MGYRTILLCLQAGEGAADLIDAAIAIADPEGGHLTGLFVHPAAAFTGLGYAELQNSAARLIEVHRREGQERARSVAEIFHARLDGLVHHGEWRFVESDNIDPLWDVLTHAAAAEIVVIGPVGKAEKIEESFSSRLIMMSGRPVLMVPHGTSRTIGRDITLAWNGSPQAARAAFEALPILRTAEVVHIVWVDPALDDGEDHSRAADDIAATLTRAGVNCEAVVTSSEGRLVKDEILSLARDYGSDLIVMGGYGHSRLAEMFFGGVTRAMMTEMPLPVLMSN